MSNRENMTLDYRNQIIDVFFITEVLFFYSDNLTYSLSIRRQGFLDWYFVESTDSRMLINHCLVLTSINKRLPVG